MTSCRGDVCSAINCTNNKKKAPHLSFFRVPKNSERSKAWIINSGRTDLLSKTVEYLNCNIKFCGIHFEPSQFKNEVKNKLIWDAIPTLFDSENTEKTKLGSKSTYPRSNIGLAKELDKTPQSSTSKHILIETKTKDKSTEVPVIKNKNSTSRPTFISHNLKTSELVVPVGLVSIKNIEDSTTSPPSNNNNVKTIPMCNIGNTGNNKLTDTVILKNISPSIPPNLIYSCSAKNCGSDQKESPNLLFFTLPNDNKRSNEWLCNSGLINLKNYNLKFLRKKLRFCALHFEDSQFINAQKNELIENALPTIFEIPNKTHSLIPSRPSNCNQVDQKLVIPNVSSNPLGQACTDVISNSDEFLPTCENFEKVNKSEYDSNRPTEGANQVHDCSTGNVIHEHKLLTPHVPIDQNAKTRSSIAFDNNVDHHTRHKNVSNNKNICFSSCNESMVSKQHMNTSNEDHEGQLKNTTLFLKYFQCSAKDCNSNQKATPNLSFYQIPKDSERSKLWLENTKRADLFNHSLDFLHSNVRFCSLHFDDLQFTNEEKIDLVHMAVPTLFNVTNEIETVIQNQVVDTECSHLPTQIKQNVNIKTIIEEKTSYKSTKPKTVSSSLVWWKNGNEITLDRNDIVDVRNYKFKSTEVSKVNNHSCTAASLGLLNSSERNYISNLKSDLRRKNKKINSLLKKQIELKKLCSNPEKYLDKIKRSKKSSVNTDKKLLRHLLSKYLTKEALSIVLSQIKSPLVNKCGNRWEEITKQFALQMHQYTPKGYQFLSQYINLPSIRTLQTFGKGIGHHYTPELDLNKGEYLAAKNKLPADHNYNKDKNESLGKENNVGIIEHTNSPADQNPIKTMRKCLKGDCSASPSKKRKKEENEPSTSQINSSNKITSQEGFNANHFDSIISSDFYCNIPILLDETPEATIYLTGQSISNDVPVEFYPNITLKINDNIDYLGQSTKQMVMNSDTIENSSQNHNNSRQRRKHNSNVTKCENFLLALQDVRLGKLGFTKAAKLYQVNRSTLWAEYKKRGYPAKGGQKVSKLKNCFQQNIEKEKEEKHKLE